MADTAWKIVPEKSGTYILNTADTYVDRNIEIELAKASLAVEGSASATIDAVTVGAKGTNTYSVTGSKALTGTAEASVDSIGFAKDETASAAISGTASLNATIPAGTLKTTGGNNASANLNSVTIGTKNTSAGNYPVTGSGNISGSFGAAVNTEGYVRAETASGTISGSASLNTTLPAVVLQTSGGVGSAVIDSVSIGTKSGSSYPVTGSKSITGTFGASVKTEGYGRNENVDGSVSGTANLNATIPAAAATVTLSGTAAAPTIAASTSNDNIGIGTITTTKPTSGFYAAVQATAPATTLSATKTVNTAGYLGSNTEITASGATTAKTGSVYYLPINSGLVSSAEAGASLTGWTEAEVTVPSKGSLKIAEGYYPNTYITLDAMLDGKADTAGTAAEHIRTGYIAYNVDGEKLTGTMAAATFGINTTTLPAGTATITGPTYNSTSGKFDMGSSGTASGTITVSAASTGFIDNGDVAKSETISGTVNGSKALDKIAGSISISGTKTVTPVISRQAFTITNVTDAANGAAVTTAPTSGVYVKVNSAAASTNVNAAATISTAGYGTSTQHGIAGSGNVAVGANASADTYIPIKTGSASVNAKSDLAITAGNPTLNSSTGKYDISLSTSGTVTGSASAGWITSVASASVSGSGTKSLNAAALTHGNTASSETKVSVSASGTRSSNLAAPGSDTTYYVTVNASQSAAGSVTHSASVSEGYVPTAGLSANATIPTNAQISGNGDKVYLKSTAITNSLSSSITSGYNLSVLNTAPDAPYITLTSQGSATSGAVYTGTSTAVNKYIKVYSGEYTIV